MNAMQLLEVSERIRALVLPEAHIDDVEVIAAGPYSASPAWSPTTPAVVDLPQHCRVKLLIEPSIHVEVWLPIDGWNGRFQGIGDSGFVGVISYWRLASAVRDGFAAASTDTGHAGKLPTPRLDGSWAIGRPDLVADYGHRAVHEMTLKAKAVVEAFYGQPAHHAYWNGCSEGGREGLMEAQLYPADYDGILAGAPAINISVMHSGQIWAAQHTLVDPETHITADQYAAINAWVLDNWDTHDGALDGVIEDPRQVVVDYTAVQAAAGLTDKQVETLRALYQGPVNAAGESVYPGLMPGGETQWGPLVGGPKPFPVGVGMYGQLVFEEADWDWRTFNYDTDLETAIARLRPVMDMIDPDLRPFKQCGGKLILFHGWSDFGISPEFTRRYYEAVMDKLGGRAVAEEVSRLFLLPGVGHCRGGTGADQFDALGPLVRWVEEGVAPDDIVASRVIDGEVVRTRPLCAYPRVARWTGAGSIDDAANFTCVEPG
jgi:feruloyl esterase